MPPTRRLLAPLLLLWVWMACAGTTTDRAWWSDLSAADRLADDRRYDEAEAAYRALLPTVPTESDRRYIEYRFGYFEELRGNFESAIDLYRGLVENTVIYDDADEWTPRAMFRMGLILYDHLGQQGEALEIWDQIVHHYPEIEGPAHRALDGLVVHWEQNGLHEEAIAYFAGEFATLEHTQLGDNMLYWLGYWLRYYVGDYDAAVEVFTRLRQQYIGRSGLREEGDWHVIEMLHEREEYEREVRLLDDIRRERRQTILGVVATTNMENASYRIGEVNYVNIGDPEQAIADWTLFLDTWKYSLFRDDAMYGIINALVDLGDGVRLAPACERFAEEFYESRFLDEVEETCGGSVDSSQVITP